MSDSKFLMGRTVTRAEFEQMKAAMSGEQGKQMAEAMVAMESAFGGGDGPVETRYLDVPFPAAVPEKDARAAMELVRYGYADSWFDKLKVEIDLFWIPNPELVKVAVDWGQKLPEEPRFDEKQLVHTSEIPCPEGEEAKIAGALKPKATISTATGVKVLVFKAADVGKDRDGWSLTLLDRNNISLKRPAGADEAVVAAFDASGRRLDWSSTGSTVAHASGKPVWELEWDDLTEDKFTRTYTASYHGFPAEVRVAVPTSRVEVAAPLTVVLAPKTGGGPPAGARFARARDVKFAELTEKQVREQTVVRFSRNQAEMEKGQPTVKLQLPACDNSAYATLEFEDFELPGCSGFETVNGGTDFTTYAATRRFTAEDGTMDFPKLKRIKGAVKVRYPRRVQVLRGKKGAVGPVTIEVKGVRVGVSYDPEKAPGLEENVESFMPDDLERVVARHESGHALRRLPFQGMHSTEKGMRREYEFWGTPAEVEVRLPSDYVEFRVPIDVKVE